MVFKYLRKPAGTVRNLFLETFPWLALVTRIPTGSLDTKKMSRRTQRKETTSFGKKIKIEIQSENRESCPESVVQKFEEKKGLLKKAFDFWLKTKP